MVAGRLEGRSLAGHLLTALRDTAVRDGLARVSVLHVDREADLGTYVEPNVWIRHR